MSTMFLHVINARYVADHRIDVWFNDGSDAQIDLFHSLTGPIFQPLRDPAYFRRFRIEGHTLTWPNGADFAPEYLQSLAKHVHQRDRITSKEAAG